MNPVRTSLVVKNLSRKTKDICYWQRTAVRYKHHNEESIISYGEDVICGKDKGLPIVALESTIITHGMPYPDNLDTALDVEEVIRNKVEKTFL